MGNPNDMQAHVKQKGNAPITCTCLVVLKLNLFVVLCANSWKNLMSICCGVDRGHSASTAIIVFVLSLSSQPVAEPEPT